MKGFVEANEGKGRGAICRRVDRGHFKEAMDWRARVATSRK